ncbi:MAG TPA: hypothetical protein VG106_14305 [Vicinamibacterales bacterium]|nr:hypothetical protein [Vicinamibacterales bacterium]
MSQHYSEADLLETYYTQPGESLPVMMHLADCADCAARYERVEKKVRGLAACEHDKPETFWARQRMSIMRRIDAEGRRTSTFARGARLAAAAALVVVVGGVATWQVNEESRSQGVEKKTTTASVSLDDSTTRRLDDSAAADPWQSDELNEYQSMVAWESWVDADTRNGDTSL